MLVIIDEAHIAARGKSIWSATKDKSQTLSKMLCGILCKGSDIKSVMCERNIKLIYYSATPNGVLTDVGIYGKDENVLFMEPGTGYNSVYDYYQRGLIRDSFRLPGYIIVRVGGRVNIGKVMEQFQKRFGIEERDIFYFDMKGIHQGGSKIEEYGDINSLLNIKPPKIKIIALKNLFSCSFTIKDKTNIRLMIENRSKKTNDSSIIQALAGRA